MKQMTSRCSNHKQQGEHVRVTKLATSRDGESYFEDIELEMHTATVAEGVPPMRVSSPVPVTAAFFVEPPAGATAYKVHVTPRRQFVLVISGRVAVETTDGERREFAPGDVVLAEDTTGRGHLTVPLTADVRLMMVPLAAEEVQEVHAGSRAAQP
jgi:hypothetical protein